MEETLARSLHSLNTLWGELSGLELTAWRNHPPIDLPEFVYQAAVSEGGRIRQVRGLSGTWWVGRSGHPGEAVYLATREFGDITPGFLNTSLVILDQLLELQFAGRTPEDKSRISGDQFDFILNSTQAAVDSQATLESLLNDSLRDLQALLSAEEVFILRRTRGLAHLEAPGEGEPAYLGELLEIVDGLDASFFRHAANREQSLPARAYSLGGQAPVDILLTPIPTQTPSRSVLVAARVGPGAIHEARAFLPVAARQLSLLSQIRAGLDQRGPGSRLDHELHVSSQIQENFLPLQLPTIPGLDFAATLQPAHHVGGDFYDVIPVPDGLMILIGDVAGKGIPAAILTALIHATLKGESRRETRPAIVLSSINDLIYDELDRSETFITAFLAFLQTDSMRLTYASAGHTNTLVWQAGPQDVIQLGSTGLPLGIVPDAYFTERNLELSPGDVLVLYSDGITEAENAVGRVFGTQALIDLLTATHSTAAQRQLETIIRALDLHRGSLPLSDDAALFLAQIQTTDGEDSLHSVPFVYMAEAGSVRQIAQFARQAAACLEFDTPERQAGFLDEWELAVSEIVTNIVVHAYRKTPYTGRIQGRVTPSTKRIKMDIIDSGVVYTPPENMAYDPHDPPISGYGLLLASQLLDTCEYKRLPGGRNHWRLEKQL